MRPLILDFKLARHEDQSPVRYTYDPVEAMNVVFIEGERKSFIDMSSSTIEMFTKTKVERERDDDQFLKELETKTEMRRERDDREDMVLEMMTKTLTARERDDRDNLMLEMLTKTRQQRERDDEHFDHYQQN